MAIQWFPGHMHKARKQIEESMPKIDLVIEVLDARIPFSSENPLIAELRNSHGNLKPVVKVLNKSDLADPRLTSQWLEYLEQSRNVRAVPLTTEQPAQIRRLIDTCHGFFPDRDTAIKPIRTMIMGIPNVGKSTLINTLAGRAIAKTGNEPAITKRQQQIDLGNGIILSDTPGILWPKVENEHSGYRLAATGAIRETAMEYEDVAYFALDFLREGYPAELAARYGLDEFPVETLDLLDRIGKKRGCVVSGGRVDRHKVSVLLLNELRAGLIGQVTLETPQMIEQELIELTAELQRKAEEKTARKEAYKKRRS